MIFTDVETLEIRQQETPRPLKRPSELVVEDKNTIEDRVGLLFEINQLTTIQKI